MFQGLGRHLRSVSHFIGKCSLFPVVMDYGLYPPPYRYTADQVPYQNMQVTHTIDLIGATSVHIKKQLGDAKQRFCTLQVTGRAVNPQNIPLVIIYRGKPTPGNPRIPISHLLKKELPLYDPRVIVLWDPKGYLNEDQATDWYQTFNDNTKDGRDRMLQIRVV